jgi:septal ring factor EnvC (AmiA/AmiB activator)
VLAATLCLGFAAARAAPAENRVAPQRKQALQAEQRGLQHRLNSLRAQMAKAASSRAEAADLLRESEAAISDTNRRLRDLARERQALQRQIDDLGERRRALASRGGAEEAALRAVLRRQLMLARQNPLQQWLAGSDPSLARRELIYWSRLGAAHKREIVALRAGSAELEQLAAQSRAKHGELAGLLQAERVNRQELQKQQAARAGALDRIARRLAGQQRSLAALERDDLRLSGLIADLERLLAERTRRDQQVKPRAAAPGRAGQGTPEPPVDPDSSGFAHLRGKLVLPVRGEVMARFGSPRRTEAGVDAPTWKGVFIRGAAGADFHAVAAGQVVFADWLRGFGNLLILDHGEGFLSVYGNNEAPLAGIGQRVDAGDPIATVGSSGGNSDAGLYFELRFQGRPVDPLRWAQAR